MPARAIANVLTGLMRSVFATGARGWRSSVSCIGAGRGTALVAIKVRNRRAVRAGQGRRPYFSGLRATMFRFSAGLGIWLSRIFRPRARASASLVT